MSTRHLLPDTLLTILPKFGVLIKFVPRRIRRNSINQIFTTRIHVSTSHLSCLDGEAGVYRQVSQRLNSSYTLNLKQTISSVMDTNPSDFETLHDFRFYRICCVVRWIFPETRKSLTLLLNKIFAGYSVLFRFREGKNFYRRNTYSGLNFLPNLAANRHVQRIWTTERQHAKISKQVRRIITWI